MRKCGASNRLLALVEDDFWQVYFRRMACRGRRMKPMGKACHDCAMHEPLHAAYSDELGKQPPEVRTEASLRWFCHNSPRRACRGNIDRLGIAAA